MRNHQPTSPKLCLIAPQDVRNLSRNEKNMIKPFFLLFYGTEPPINLNVVRRSQLIMQEYQKMLRIHQNT